MKSWILNLAIKYIAWYVGKMPKYEGITFDMTAWRTDELQGDRRHIEMGYIHYRCKSRQVADLLVGLLEKCGITRDVEITFKKEIPNTKDVKITFNKDTSNENEV